MAVVGMLLIDRLHKLLSGIVVANVTFIKGKSSSVSELKNKIGGSLNLAALKPQQPRAFTPGGNHVTLFSAVCECATRHVDTLYCQAPKHLHDERTIATSILIMRHQLQVRCRLTLCDFSS
jgi:hypothetical protein